MIDPLPYFSGEDELAALLLQILLDHCSGDGQMRGLHQPRDPHALYSYDQASYADAMIAMHREGLIEITKQDGARIWAKVLPVGRAFLDRFHIDQQRNAAASWRHSPAIIDWSQCAATYGITPRATVPQRYLLPPARAVSTIPALGRVAEESRGPSTRRPPIPYSCAAPGCCSVQASCRSVFSGIVGF